MNPECKNVDNYLDGQLSATAQTRFVRHLEVCPACQREVEIDRELDDSIKDAWQDVVAPSTLVDVLEDKLSWNRRSPSRHSTTVFALVTFAATLLIAALLGIQYLVDDGPSLTETTHPKDVPSIPQQPPEISLSSEPRVAVIPTTESNTIMTPLTESRSDYTILRAYTIVSVQSQSSPLSERKDDPTQ